MKTVGASDVRSRRQVDDDAHGSIENIGFSRATPPSEGEFHAEATRDRFASPVGFEQLKPRRGVPKDQVSSDQDRRIRQAMVQLVAERGHDAVSVRDVVTRAGVSSRAFYEQYSGKEDCLVRCYDAMAGATAWALLKAAPRTLEPEQRLVAVLDEFIRGLARRPAAGKFALIECVTGGPAARRESRRMEAIHRALLAECFVIGPVDRKREEFFRAAAADGITQVCRAALLDGRIADLCAKSSELASWVTDLRRTLERRPPALPLHSAQPSTRNRTAWREAYSPSQTDDVHDSITRAVLGLVARDGEGQLGVDRIRFEAGVSRRRFFEAFDGLEACVTAARQRLFDLSVRGTIRLGQGSQGSGGPTRWRDLFERWIEDPNLAAFLLDARTSGREGLGWEISQVRSLADLAPGPRGGLPPLEVEAWLAAGWGAMRRAAVTGSGQADAVALADELARRAFPGHLYESLEEYGPPLVKFDYTETSDRKGSMNRRRDV